MTVLASARPRAGGRSSIRLDLLGERLGKDRMGKPHQNRARQHPGDQDGQDGVGEFLVEDAEQRHDNRDDEHEKDGRPSLSRRLRGKTHKIGQPQDQKEGCGTLAEDVGQNHHRDPGDQHDHRRADRLRKRHGP
jgi:hypothetical protein